MVEDDEEWPMLAAVSLASNSSMGLWQAYVENFLMLFN